MQRAPDPRFVTYRRASGMGGMMSNAPRLNGQRAAYIVDQLERFADGRRPAMVMNRVAFGLTTRQKKAVAEFVSGLQ